MEYFLKNICTDKWNLEQDKGRSFVEGTQLLQQEFPKFHSHIGLFYDKWETMLKSDIPETVNLLHKLKLKYKIYGLTNWSAETISIAYERFSFFNEFDGIVVSGQEKIIKPDYKIYQLLLDRFNLKAENTIFIDDNINNIKAAKEMGLYGIHFDNPSKLEFDLLTIAAI
jgi:2-haloacid dehalogenase